MKKIFTILLMVAFMASCAYAQAPDIRISDADGNVLDINSDGTLPVGGNPDFTTLEINNDTVLSSNSDVNNGLVVERVDSTSHRMLLLNRPDTTISDGNLLGLVGFGGDDATVARTLGAVIRVQATEGWTPGVQSGSEFQFQVNLTGEPGSGTGATTTAFTINQDNDGIVQSLIAFQADDYYSGDGTQGMTGSCGSATTLTVKDGIITACA